MVDDDFEEFSQSKPRASLRRRQQPHLSAVKSSSKRKASSEYLYTMFAY